MRDGALAWSNIVSRHEFPSVSDPSTDNEGVPQEIYHANTQCVPPVFLVSLPKSSQWQAAFSNKSQGVMWVRVVLHPRCAELRALTGSQVRARARRCIFRNLEGPWRRSEDRAADPPASGSASRSTDIGAEETLRGREWRADRYCYLFRG